MPDPAPIDLHSEQFMTLLTDALRSGPGSPEWHQAVKTLRASNQNVDEFTLLHSAREHLESGKEWRSIRAGPGFSRKVLDGIEAQARPPTGLPTANIIAFIAAGVLLSVVAVVGVFLLKGGGAQQQAIDQLTNTIFGNRFLSANFTAPALPEGWNKFGELPVFTRNNELRPATLPASADPKDYKAGGLVTATPIPAEQPFEVDVTLKATKPTDTGMVQVFVSDEPITTASPDRGHTLVWQLKAGEARVFLAGVPQGEKVANPRDLQVRLIINRDTAIVELAGKRLYAGPHQLAPDKPRYVGVRFLRRGGETWDHLGVASIALQKP